MADSKPEIARTDPVLGRRPKARTGLSASSALTGIWVVVLTSFVIATLHFARDILFPLALAALLAFLLAPVVTWLERWMGRIGAILTVVMLILATAVGVGWVLSRQLSDLATKLPNYKENFQIKLRSLRDVTGGRFKRISDTLGELRKELPGGVSASTTHEMGAEARAPAAPPVTRPVAVEVVESTQADPMQLVRVILAPLLGPLGTSAFVVLLVIVMLLKREDLRGRVIRLIGQGRISATTLAMDDAGTRVNRYLSTQLLLNVIYGALVALGLYFIGVPNAPLWGAGATMLRFIPYLGPWIGATFPVVVSLAVAPGWMMPVLTLGLFVVVELISNNLLEPWLYGTRTGVSPVALIFAAVFWAWLWGPAGLVLATPMTVCLVVMGRHIPRLALLGVVLSDEDALTPAEDCYYRLLTVGDQDEMDLVEGYLKAHSPASLFDSVLIPVLSAVEIDHRSELLDEGQRTLVLQGMRDVVDDLDVGVVGQSRTRAVVPGEVETPGKTRRAYCVPAGGDRDELSGRMLSYLLRGEGYTVESASAGLGAEEVVRRVKEAVVDVVCISVTMPSTVLHARQLCLKLQALSPRPRVLVGLWGATENLAEASRRVRESGADEVVSTLGEGVTWMGRAPEEMREIGGLDRVR